MNSTPLSPECPICHKRLVFNSNSSLDWLVCPTKVLIDVGDDLLRSKSHYWFCEPVEEFIYPPFTIVLSPDGQERTDIWWRDDSPTATVAFKMNFPVKKTVSIPKLLDLPWDNEEQVLDTLHYYLTFS